MSACAVRRLLIEQRDEQPLMQFGADEAQPLLQPGASGLIRRRELCRGVTSSDILQNRGILTEEGAVVEAQQRHQAERVDLAVIRAGTVDGMFGLGVDLDEADIANAGFVKRDPARQRAGHWREIKVHDVSLSFLYHSA